MHLHYYSGVFFYIVTYDLMTLLPSLTSHRRSFSRWLKIKPPHNKYFQAEKQFVYCLFCQYEFLQNGRLTVKDWTVFRIDQKCLLDSVTSRVRCVGLSAPSSQSEKEKSFFLFFLRLVMLHQSCVLFDPLYFNIPSSVVSKESKHHCAFAAVWG